MSTCSLNLRVGAIGKRWCWDVDVIRSAVADTDDTVYTGDRTPFRPTWFRQTLFRQTWLRQTAWGVTHRLYLHPHPTPTCHIHVSYIFYIYVRMYVNGRSHTHISDICSRLCWHIGIMYVPCMLLIRSHILRVYGDKYVLWLCYICLLVCCLYGVYILVYMWCSNYVHVSYIFYMYVGIYVNGRWYVCQHVCFFCMSHIWAFRMGHGVSTKCWRYFRPLDLQ